MAYVRLDCGMIHSTTWVDRPAREVFITALLMALPIEVTEDMPQLNVRNLEATGWVVPPGKYGFVEAAGAGIVRQAGIDTEEGLDALERLGEPDPESRSQAFDGRRLVRVEGGYLALNYQRYRDKDHTAAARQRRYRARQKRDTCNAVTSRVVTEAVSISNKQEAPQGGSLQARAREGRPTPVAAQRFERSFDQDVSGWQGVTDEQRDYARQNGLDLDVEARGFKANARKRSLTCADWSAAFDEWLTRSLKYARQSKGAAEPSSDREIESQHDRDKYEKILKQRKAQLAKLREEEKL